MKQKASEYICVVCKKNLAQSWHHLILPGRGISRKEDDKYAIPVCGDGKPWDKLCHGRCQRNEISLVLQGIFLLIFHGDLSRLSVILSNYLTIGDVTEILRRELGR